MGIQTKRELNDNDNADDDFRHLLHSFGEPAAVPPPSDLVVRTARRIPADAPHVVFRRQRVNYAVRLTIVFVLIMLAALGTLSQYSGPSTALFGSGDVGLSRVLLISQLALKPLLGIIRNLSLMLFGVGLMAILSSIIILRFSARPVLVHVSRRG